jgi:hypothetical protein
VLFFRGQADARWSLLPGLARTTSGDSRNIEKIVYYDFLTRAGDLVSDGGSSWNHLLTMQHHGLPTRLLDWSETFGVALYFALKAPRTDAAVWVLDPFRLNAVSLGDGALPRPTDLGGEYTDFFIDESRPFDPRVVAIAPLRHNPRIHRQRGGFTLHRNLDTPLETLYPDAVRKLTIPRAAHAGARDFLRLAGISEFTLFPDLDGLSRELRDEYL